MLDLQLDIDMHMKETADLILQKEQGIAEMVRILCGAYDRVAYSCIYFTWFSLLP
jgi:hypothetical protein